MPGTRATDAHLVNFFRSATDEAGQPLGRALGHGDTLGRAESIIDLLGLEGRAFADEVTSAANKVLVNQGPLWGEGKALTQTIQAVNNLYRGFRATLDNSALGIQGLLGMAADQRAYGKALRVNLRFWADEQVLGRFLSQFDEATRGGARLDSAGWAREGLQFDGVNTEFQLGQGATVRLGRLWPVLLFGVVIRSLSLCCMQFNPGQGMVLGSGVGIWCGDAKRKSSRRRDNLIVE